MSRSVTPTPRPSRWTPERQLRFLDSLAHTRSVSKAAVSAGMSRESAHRLRARSEGGLFALLWDRALQSDDPRNRHTTDLSDGGLARLLGNHFRRKTGDFAGIGRLGDASGDQ